MLTSNTCVCMWIYLKNKVIESLPKNIWQFCLPKTNTTIIWHPIRTKIYLEWLAKTNSVLKFQAIVAEYYATKFVKDRHTEGKNSIPILLRSGGIKSNMKSERGTKLQEIYKRTVVCSFAWLGLFFVNLKC